MDFGKILDEWAKTHAPVDKDAIAERTGRGDTPAGKPSRADFRKMPPQATLDLHGMREGEARTAVRSFIAASAAHGLEKVSIIHGKGNHSQDEQVLMHVVREELEKNPRAGEFEFADNRHGGRGATWVRIRQAISRGR